MFLANFHDCSMSDHYLFMYFRNMDNFSNSGRKSVIPGLVVNNTATSIYGEEGIEFDTGYMYIFYISIRTMSG